MPGVSDYWKSCRVPELAQAVLQGLAVPATGWRPQYLVAVAYRHATAGRCIVTGLVIAIIVIRRMVSHAGKGPVFRYDRQFESRS